MELEEATQPTQNTQGKMDPRRMGRNNSGLCDADISDVMCILHPCSPAAFRIVASTTEMSPQNVLQIDGLNSDLSESEVDEQETFILSEDAPHQAMDLALRFSTQLKNPALGFVFGRNAAVCDIVLYTDTFKRVSNAHFSIFVNRSGVLMLRDMSTNGTIVDDVLLKGKQNSIQHRRMLNPGSVIQILSPKPDDIVKFIVRIPSREGHLHEYEQKFQGFMRRAALAEVQTQQANARDAHAAQNEPHSQLAPYVKAPLVQKQFTMHWSGGDKYNVVGLIGKGAFATVYQLATKSEGQLFAAKELEKRRFMKNGVLDRKLDNEMQIMKAVNHPNIVQYVDYVDYINHMYIIMEFVPCGDLQNYLSHRVPLREDLGRSMAAQVLDALTYLHQKKITHRDIKPDNILLANMDPNNFTVKLSDFGLSKVVQDNETFLKTFCGTLLYCAPEVFPHYDAHVANKGKKRLRGRGASSSKFHSYSQSVDVWSFGAVLWYSLCLKPPFEGVADNTGRGMFDKIMRTPLDTSELVHYDVSDISISLLVAMLNTDPAARPSPSACLRHEWFTKGQPLPSTGAVGSPTQGLGAIAEEEEAGDDPEAAALSLDELEIGNDVLPSEVSIHSGSFDFFDPRQSKRIKSSAFNYRDPNAVVDSSPDITHQPIPIAHNLEDASVPAHMSAQPPRRKLFGEISHSTLANLPAQTRQTNDTREESPHYRVDHDDGQLTASQEVLKAMGEGAAASPSLLGAESLVRELHMDSPRSPQSPGAELNEPATPTTPSHRDRGVSGGANLASTNDEVTPKPPQRSVFSRQIELPIPASFYYEAHDPSTHTLEYASKKSGHDYIANIASFGPTSDTSLPTTATASATEDEAEEQTAAATQMPEQHNVANEIPVAVPTAFVKPPPRLGRLVSTPDSFTPITLNLTDRLSMWGRDLSNTHVFPNKYDTRVPKRGIFIIFHARGIDKLTETDDSWTKLPDLHCVVSTESSKGIQVNGVLLKNSEPGKRAFGRIHTGDEIVVADGKDGRLKFVCEFFHGEGRERRPDTAARFVIEMESTGLKTKGKEQELDTEESTV